ncbi:4-hydroxy-2-oxoheptanedioate aldolase [Pigmentiphaga soli]|uniref:4-hydroxy-2-oxoheptanedioate aldolase n=1 Tax=Pigmentiphaga soli TaxID=1007095 RepID=A0ABP8H1R7_9BURK
MENPLRARARADRLIGYWLTTASPMVTEIAAGAGFDWLLVDMEHAPNDLGDIVHHLRAAAAGGNAEPVVRMPVNDAVMVKRLLDAGARSLMFPNVQNADEARAAVAATRYPPDGIRGFSTVSRATRFGRLKDYAPRACETIYVIVQVETSQAIDNAAEIAAVEGVDCVFVGPNDLAANMGHLGKASAPEVQRKILDALAAIRSKGKRAGLLDYNVDSARKMFDAGFGLIAVGGDSGSIARAMDDLVARFRQGSQGNVNLG